MRNPTDSDHDIEERAEALLEDVTYDEELAAQMAKDARKVSNGELSERAYHERYREKVSEEFDIDVPSFEELPDNRQQAVENEATRQTSLGGQAQSRRSVLLAAGAMAAGAATAGIGGYTDAVSAQTEPPGESAQDFPEQIALVDRSVGMVVDTEECIKCLQCVQACRDENKTYVGDFWTLVIRYQREDREYDGPEDCETLPRRCQHCDDAPCVRVCPNESRIQHYDGRVLCNYDTCLGCKYCEVACPYHVNSFQYSQPTGYFQHDRRDERDRWVAGPPPDGSCSKCTYCAHRRFDGDLDGSTACEEICPVDALQFGDLSDPDSDPNQYLADHPDIDFADGDVIKEKDADEIDGIFQLHTDASNPNEYYIGDDPSDVEIERVPGPTTHADIGLEEPSPMKPD